MSTLHDPRPKQSSIGWLFSIVRFGAMVGVGCLSLIVAIAAIGLIVLELSQEPWHRGGCQDAYTELESDIRAGLEWQTTLLSLTMVDPGDRYLYLAGTITSPDIEGEQVAVWATDRSYRGELWYVGEIVPVNPTAMAVSNHQHPTWVRPEQFRTARQRIGKEPTLIAKVSMSDSGALRAAECIEEGKGKAFASYVSIIPPGSQVSMRSRTAPPSPPARPPAPASPAPRRNGSASPPRSPAASDEGHRRHGSSSR